MIDRSQVRDDEEVQRAVRSAFAGSIPERTQELSELWYKYQLQFLLDQDNSPDGKFLMQGGLYRYVSFNHRTMRAFWVATFAAWEAYRVSAEAMDDLSRFHELLKCVRDILEADDPTRVALPKGVGEPGQFADKLVDPHARAAGELSIFAISWAFLHEIWHCQHQQADTSTSNEENVEAKRGEELSCDAFATEFIVSRAYDFARDTGSDPQHVMQKRQIGIFLGLVALTVISHGHWEETDSHPSMQSRVDAVWKYLAEEAPNVPAALIALFAFETLKKVWPDAPEPGATAQLIDKH